MKTMSTRAITLFVSLLFCILFALLVFLQDAEPPDELLSLDGPIVNRTPIYSKGKLTGFRFCIGNPLMTLTYQDPDPRVQSVWATMENARRVSVQYSTRPGRNPTLWGLEVEGRTLATVTELKAARVSSLVLYLAGAIASAFVSGFVFIQMWRARATSAP